MQKINMKKEKILVGLSWGVDSAVSAFLLREQGYDVTAGFMINYLAPEWEVCPTLEDIEIAKEVAAYLGIPFFTFDYREEYEKKVLEYMYEGYQKGVTPNPDIMCNSEIKFRVFLDEAMELGFDKVATGHYARIKNDEQWYHLLKWIDANKDQSYFLAGLDQDQLSKAIFPIWELEKSEVRKIAKKAWLPNANRKDSQWICFVGKVNMADFLEKKIKPKPGKVLNTKWEILWEHKWVYYYTIGQRKGLDIWGQSEPIFVVRKDLENNEIIVGTKDDLDLFASELYLGDIHFVTDEVITFPIELNCKIRYRQADQACRVEKLEKWYKVLFQNKQRAIASGQVCAFYRDEELIMSGVID